MTVMAPEPITDEDLDWLRGNIESAASGLGDDYIARLIARIDTMREVNARRAEAMMGRQDWSADDALAALAAAMRGGDAP